MNLVAWMIVACELAFWIVIGTGLTARYVFKLRRLGLVLLMLTPVVDLILFVTTSVDLWRGATATTAHAIAAVYIGVSLAFGKGMIQWADERFQYYVTKQGSKPVRRVGLDHAKHYAKGWVKHLVAYLIGAGLLAGTIYLIQDASRTESMNGVIQLWSVVLGIDLVITISYFVFPRKVSGK